MYRNSGQEIQGLGVWDLEVGIRTAWLGPLEAGASELSLTKGSNSRKRMFIPILAAGSLELAESLMQAGTVPVAGTKEDQDQQQQEAEEQARGQGAGGCGKRLTQAENG